MKKNKQALQRRIAKACSSVFALAVFIIPTIATAKWLVGVYQSRDSRVVTSIASFNERNQDINKQDLQPFNEPIVSITFDDGWESVYTHAISVLQRYGLHTTQYIISGTFDNELYMSKAQVLSLKNAGTEIGSHTATHQDLTTLTDEQLIKELVDSQKSLDESFGGNTRDFTSPLGAYNVHTIEVIKKYYRSHKNAEGDPAAGPTQPINTTNNFDAYNIQSYSVRRTTTLEDIKKLIKDAEDNNGWLVLTYHQIDDSGELYSVSPQVFEQQIELISKSRLRSATVGNVLDRIEQSKKVGQ